MKRKAVVRQFVCVTTHTGDNRSGLPRGPTKSRVVQLPATKEPQMSFRTALLAAIVAISAVSTVQSTSAQNYPAKPIHLIVPYPAGGGTDFFARLVGQKMSELVGQPIVIENKPGAPFAVVPLPSANGQS